MGGIKIASLALLTLIFLYLTYVVRYALATGFGDAMASSTIVGNYSSDISSDATRPYTNFRDSAPSWDSKSMHRGTNGLHYKKNNGLDSQWGLNLHHLRLTRLFHRQLRDRNKFLFAGNDSRSIWNASKPYHRGNSSSLESSKSSVHTKAAPFLSVQQENSTYQWGPNLKPGIFQTHHLPPQWARTNTSDIKSKMMKDFSVSEWREKSRKHQLSQRLGDRNSQTKVIAQSPINVNYDVRSPAIISKSETSTAELEIMNALQAGGIKIPSNASSTSDMETFNNKRFRSRNILQYPKWPRKSSLKSRRISNVKEDLTNPESGLDFRIHRISKRTSAWRSQTSGRRGRFQDDSLPFPGYGGFGNEFPDFPPAPLGPPLSSPPQPVSLRVVVHLRINRGYERVLDSAINMGSRDRDFLPLTRFIRPTGKLVRLRGDKPRDILQAFCDDILQPSTTAIFHLVNPFFHTRSWSSAQYVSNLLSTLDMPVITWGPEYIGTTDKKESDSLQLNISPTLHHQAQAMLSVLRHYNWTHFAVVYTPVPGHDTFITALKILVNDHKSKGERNGFKFTIIDHVEVTNASDSNSTKKDLMLLRQTETRIVLLYCMEGDTLNILDQASKLGLVDKDYLWFLTFEAVNKNKKLNANNLPLGLLGIYYDHREDEMERAIKTAVAVWMKGLKQSVMATTNSDGIPTGLPWSMSNLECQSKNSLLWKDGPMFYNFLRNVSFENVAFNDMGQLETKDISIVNVQPPLDEEDDQKWRQVGMFTTSGIQMKRITWPGSALNPPTGKPKRHFLRIVTREEPPFVEYRDLNKNGSCGYFSYLCHVYERDEDEIRLSNITVKKCCTGLSIDFLHRLSVQLNFEFYLYEVEDNQWGTKNPDGTWDGIVGELRQGKADMAVSAMTIEADRSTAINFSVPYMETGITFMVAIREGAISATAFLEPYDYPSWCLILVCSVHVTGASIFLFEWFSPYGLDHGKRMSPTYRFSLFRTFWLMWAMLFGAAVTTDTPRGVSSKFVSNIWALFALVFSASYTANLAAFMITKEEYYDISGMQDWRLQNPYAMNPPFQFATIPNGTTESNIKKNSPKMYEYMKKHTQRSVEQAMEALKRHKLHAFIYDASVLEYQEGKDKDCQLITVGNWYAATGFGVGLPLRSQWLEKVNQVIYKLQYEGEMERLKEFWLSGACHMKRKKSNNNRGIGNGVSSTTLGILNFTSAFIFLAAGTGLAAVTFILEHCYFCCARKRLSSWDKKGCCALVSLSMGMSLSFQDSVREAMDIHRRSKQRCKSPLCETKLWKANYELKQAKTEIGRLQSQLARKAIEGAKNTSTCTTNNIWKYDPTTTLRESKSGYAMDDNDDISSDEEAVRVTLL